MKLIESATGNSYAENIEQGIAGPLRLRSTYAGQDIDRGLVTPGYCRDLHPEQALENIVPRYHPGWCKTGLIVSTTDETVKFYDALFAGKLISRQSLAEMTKPVWIGEDAGPFFRKPSYGLGLMIDPDWRYGGLFGHGGDGPGFTTWAMHLPDFDGRAVTLAIFCNASMDAQPFELVEALLNVLKTA